MSIFVWNQKQSSHGELDAVPAEPLSNDNDPKLNISENGVETVKMANHIDETDNVKSDSDKENL